MDQLKELRIGGTEEGRITYDFAGAWCPGKIDLLVSGAPGLRGMSGLIRLRGRRDMYTYSSDNTQVAAQS